MDEKHFSLMLYTNISLTEDLSNDKITQEDELFLVKTRHQEKRTVSVSVATKFYLHVAATIGKKIMLCKHIMAVMPCCKDIIWESFAHAYSSSKFFKIDVNVIEGDQMEVKLLPRLIKMK